MVNPDRHKQVGKKAPWPKGRGRHGLSDEQSEEWKKLRRKIERRLSYPEKSSEKVRASRRGMAEYIGVESKSVTRWLRGDLTPNAEHLPLIQEWLKELGD